MRDLWFWFMAVILISFYGGQIFAENFLENKYIKKSTVISIFSDPPPDSWKMFCNDIAMDDMYGYPYLMSAKQYQDRINMLNNELAKTRR